jgi:hypothetical protein
MRGFGLQRGRTKLPPRGGREKNVRKPLAFLKEPFDFLRQTASIENWYSQVVEFRTACTLEAVTY